MAGRRFLPGTLVSPTNNTDHLQQVEDYDYRYENILFKKYLIYVFQYIQKTDIPVLYIFIPGFKIITTFDWLKQRV
jgi:hypothetical protein